MFWPLKGEAEATTSSAHRLAGFRNTGQKLIALLFWFHLEIPFWVWGFASVQGKGSGAGEGGSCQSRAASGRMSWQVEQTGCQATRW